MKLMKKITAAGIAAVTAVSVFAFTACDNGEGGYGDEKSAKEATSVIEKLDEVKTDGVSVNGTVKASGMEYGVSALASAASGAFDVTLKGKVPYNGTVVEAYKYYFMRDWKIYGAESLAPVEDYTKLTLEPVVDLAATISEGAGAQANAMLNMYVPAVVNAVVSAETYTLLSLGKVTNSVAYKDNTITLDYNLAIYNMFNDVKSVIDGIEATTTVGDILGNATLKKYAEIFTELVDYEDLVSTVTMIKTMLQAQTPQLPAPAAAVEGGENEGDVSEPEYPSETETGLAVVGVIVEVLDSLLKTVTPDANSSTYDYLVKLLSSDELKNKINELYAQTNEGVLLEKSLDKYTVKDIMSLAMETELTDAQVNEALTATKAEVAEVAKGITAEKFNVTQDGSTVLMDGLKYTFSYDKDYVLLSQTIAGSMSVTDPTSTPSTTAITVELSIEYGKSALTLVTLSSKLPAFPDYSGNVTE